MISEKFLINAKVMHKRFKPKVNEFLYRVFYICFDISKVQNLKNPFFSINKFNIFSFFTKDHGYKNDQTLEKFIFDILGWEKIKCDGKIYLMTYPRVLGYVFNPVSFWFCLNKNDELVAVLAQVNNTFKEHHNYLIFEKDGSPLRSDKSYTALKEFHVSPFMKRRGKYKFRFNLTQEKVGAYINLVDDNDEMMLATYVKGKTEKFSQLNLIKKFILIPFMTFKVIILIHFQALKLVLKRIKYIRQPKKIEKLVTKTFDWIKCN